MIQIAVGNKLYSSWSLRAGMLLRAFDIPFEETVIPMYKEDTTAKMRAFGPTGKVPVIQDGNIKVWESLAIIEYIADRFPDKHIWPEDMAARAHARAASSEMHSGFMGLRSSCPMNLTASFKHRERSEAVMSDLARLDELWSEARGMYATSGDFLYGAFSAADAMFMPVVTRIDTYRLYASDNMERYMRAMLNHPAFIAWKAEAFKEPWFLPHYEENEVLDQRHYLPMEGQA
jgi:glutathione S-transferase